MKVEVSHHTDASEPDARGFRDHRYDCLGKIDLTWLDSERDVYVPTSPLPRF